MALVSLPEDCSMVGVSPDGPTIFPFLKAPFRLVPRTFSQTEIVESVASSLKYSVLISILGSCSKFHFSIIRELSVLGSLPFRLSNADFQSCLFSDRNAKRKLKIPLLPFEIRILFFVFSLALIDLIILSTVPHPQWSLTGHTICSMNFVCEIVQVFYFSKLSRGSSDFFMFHLSINGLLKIQFVLLMWGWLEKRHLATRIVAC